MQNATEFSEESVLPAASFTYVWTAQEERLINASIHQARAYMPVLV